MRNYVDHSSTLLKVLNILNSYVYCSPRIAPALQELVGIKVTEVLPALQTLFLEGPLPSGLFQDNIEQFVAARQLSGHPIAVSRWKVDEN